MNTEDGEYTKPELQIGDKTVVIDSLNGVFYNKEYPLNGIGINEFSRTDEGYTVYIDKFWGTLSYDMDTEDNIELRIPHLVHADPMGISKLYGISPTDLPERDDQLNPYNQAYERRTIQGELPTTVIIDREYYIDVRLYELRNVKNFHDRLNLNDTMEIDDGRFIGFLNLKTRKFEWPDVDQQCPAGCAVIVLPNETRLDPVGWARRRGSNDDEYLWISPVQYNQRTEAFQFKNGKFEKLNFSPEGHRRQRRKHKGFGM
ncbi:hypothetical protein [Chitinophaga japonensis]|uniref:WG repeat protein n=1 Tax=Chitinophaga japonensis TaxID=104662 RepID=A0A562T2F1_CHIJA|nr:hypothetical protein [Chitinophaga japonensis]TWI87839.1 hypothetical protein LX66_1910 [Chitinophaga japonensis]